MRSTSYPSSSGLSRAPLSRRATAMVLTILAHILIILLLLRLSPTLTTPPQRERRPVSFQLLPDAQTAPTPSPRAPVVAKVKQPSGGAAPRAPRPAAAAHATTPAPTHAPPIQLNLLGGAALFDAADISKIPAHPGDEELAGGANDGAGSGKDSGSAYGPGEGPGGARLYDVDWYRKPTQAELSGYMPPGLEHPGQAMIACRMIANYHVENCRVLSETPAGSGLGRALREAAWQFRVLPPRIGGRQVLGGWVRIRFDFDVRQEK